MSKARRKVERRGRGYTRRQAEALTMLLQGGDTRRTRVRGPRAVVQHLAVTLLSWHLSARFRACGLAGRYTGVVEGV